ncbi:MAG: hypothetical protein WCR56_04670 [Bacilli bacterium]|jgi:phosphotransferase system IIB component
MQTWMIIVIVVATVIVTAAIVYLCFFFAKKRRIKQADEAVTKQVVESTSALSLDFGGTDNIISISKQGSRVTVQVKDNSLVKKDEINKIMINTMFMGNKVVFVVGSASEEFSKLLSENATKQINNH